MIRASAVTLLADVPEAHGVYDTPSMPGRDVACDIMSVGRREFYEAKSHGMNPEWVILLPDYAEYRDETVCILEGKPYRIIRTYVRNDHRIELTVERMIRHDVSDPG